MSGMRHLAHSGLHPQRIPSRGRGEYTLRYTHLIARTLLILGLFLLVPTLPAQKTNVRSPHGPLAIPCENCHTASSWRPIRAVLEFDHNKTAYPLRGQHEKVRCVECHAKPVFTDVGKNCADCHADIHLRKFGADCAQCHTVTGWQVSINQIKEHQNRFPLFGAHAAVQCDDCHKGAAVGQFQGLSTQCISCHLSDYQKTTNPPHAANTAVFNTTCNSCHSFDSWLNAKFDHSTTGFLLTQGHANVPCLSCHVGNNYHLTIAPSDCGNSGCHLTTWQTTNNPPHPTAGPVFAVSNCANCHTTAGWNSANFNHASTGFPLTNGHANVACTSCHVNNNYNLQVAPNACGTAGCHLTTWQTTTNPVHSTSGPAFGLANCANCHTTAGWNGASFDHSITGFALVGTHFTTPCASCHTNNNYTLNSADCYGCHAAAFQSTTTIGGNVPNHIRPHHHGISADGTTHCGYLQPVPH
jgi:nitrate/TMAO reductase-like tetraheme cytochrome c subunit